MVQNILSIPSIDVPDENTSAILSPEVQMPLRVRQLLDHFKGLWWDCPTSPPTFDRIYSPSEQRTLEKELQSLLKGVRKALDHLPGTEAENQELQKHFFTHASRLLHSAFGFQTAHLKYLETYGFFDVTVDFIRSARRFDPQISPTDLFQASRNLWSMNFVQLLLGMPLELTPSLLAYSMLYPYSDNYLDDPAIPYQEKLDFSRRFGQRLLGETPKAFNSNEQSMFDLVEMIEGQYERHCFPEVYESLLAIFHAQNKSMALLQGAASPYEIDVLGICFEKGGTSVLADGYLVGGRLTPAQEEFMFLYGTLTQLLDDLEDVKADLNAGLNTVFSQTAGRWPLDAITNRTISYGELLLKALENFTLPNLDPLKNLIRQSITPMMVDAAAQSPNLYTRGYLRNLQVHFPFRFSFLGKMRRKYVQNSDLPAKLVEMALPSHPSPPPIPTDRGGARR